MNQLKANLPKHLTILQEYSGHYPKMGKSAGQELNPYCLVKSSKPDDIENEFYVMFCKDNSLTYFSKICYDKIKNLLDETWYLMKNGYIGSHNKEYPYLHHLIAKFFIEKDDDNEKELSIDHINRDKFDNRIKNLRWTTQSVQTENCGKRSRKKNAMPLPEELKNCPLPKFVDYRKEVFENGSYKEYLVLDHPTVGKRLFSSKSMKINIVEKYNDIIEKMNNLNLKIEIKE
jgi:hypothetical protein